MRIITTLCLALLLGGCQAKQPQAQTTTLYKASATASWYQCCARTANGEKYNPNGPTVAHRTLPFNTKLRLTNLDNGKTVIVRVNDRGPFIAGVEIDVSRGVANTLGFTKKGKTKLKIEIIKG
jgi:rare lipoprotein A